MDYKGLTIGRRLGFRVGGVALIGAIGTLCASAPVASAATTVCTTATTLPANVSGNISVPAGASCDIDHVIVAGSVTGAAGSSVKIHDGSKISGALTTNGAAYTDLEHSTFVGAVTVIGGGANLDYNTFGAALTVTGGALGYVLDNQINGAATFSNIQAGPSSDVNYLAVDRNHIGGALHVTGNAAPIDVEENSVSGAIFITGNTGGVYNNFSLGYLGGIQLNSSTGVLSCSGNASPFVGYDNSAPRLLGQCSTFGY